MALKKKSTTQTAAEKETQTAVEGNIVEQEVVEQEVVGQVAEKVVDQVAEKVGLVEPSSEREVATQQVTAINSNNPASENNSELVKASEVVKASELVKASAGFSQQAAEQGFEGLEVGGFGTFPTIVIGA